MNTLAEMVEVAKKECKAHGVTVTSKRVNLYSLLLLSDKAVSAYELVDSYLKIFHKPVPAITVYRVLDFLQSKNLVNKLETENKFVACKHTSCGNNGSAPQFLICKQCLKVKEFSMSDETVKELQETVDHAGFRLNNSQLEMDCICKSCYENPQTHKIN